MKKQIPILIILISLFGIFFSSTSSLDQDVFYATSEYIDFIDNINSGQKINIEDSIVLIGWGKKSITPPHPTRLAGYSRRYLYNEIKDSIFCRAVTFSNRKNRVALLSLDLIMIHPSLRDAIINSTRDIVDEIYFTATHTHTSIGKWGKGPFASIVFGGYDQEVVNSICESVKQAIILATQSERTSEIAYKTIDCVNMTKNRINQSGITNSNMDLISIRHIDSHKKIIISTYTAHPTICKNSNFLSAGYPGIYNRLLLNEGYEMALFLAGGVGSTMAKLKVLHVHEPYARAEQYANSLYAFVKDSLPNSNFTPLRRLELGELMVPMPKTQLKLFGTRILTPYITRYFLGKQRPSLTYLKINSLVLLGYPADFSGEIGQEILNEYNGNLKPIFTSFNGEYIGYLTHPKYYNAKHGEAQFLNWYGPHNTNYFKRISLKYLEAIEKK